MPKNINNAEAARALVEQFDLKGRVTLLMDEMVVPVVNIADLTAQPAGGVRCGRQFSSGAGGATEFSYTGVQAAPGTKLVCHGFELPRSSSGLFRIHVLTAADVAAMTGSSLNNLFAFDRPGPDPAIIASQVINGTDTTNTLGSARSISIIRQPTNGTYFAHLDYTLYGDNLVDEAAIMVINQTINQSLEAAVFCTEFPFP